MKIIDGDIEIRPARLDDISPIERDLREADKAEVFASYGEAAGSALTLSFIVSITCMTVLYKGDPVGMFGVSPYEADGEGRLCLWMVGTNRINDFKKSFVKMSRRVVAMLLDAYPVLCNHVDARYTKAIRWLEHLGAKFEEAQPYGVQGLPFRYFEIRRI